MIDDSAIQKTTRRDLLDSCSGEATPPNDGPTSARQALDRARATGDAGLIVRALQAKAGVLERGDDFAKVYALALEAESLALAHAFGPETACANLQLGRCLAAAGHVDRALARLGESLRMYRALGSSDGEFTALQALAGFHLAQGQHRNMLVYLEASLQLIRSGESIEQREMFHADVAEGHVQYATALRAQGHLFEAQTQCDRAMGVLPEHGCAQLGRRLSGAESRWLDTAARLHLLQGQSDRAMRCAGRLLCEGRHERRVQSATRLVALASDRFADVRNAQGLPAKAIRWLVRSLRCWAQLGAWREQVASLDRLSDAQAALDHHADALRSYKTARGIENDAQAGRAVLCSALVAIEGQAERRQRVDQATLEQTDRLAALGRMVACIAHEVTQPLAAIRLVAENAMTDDAKLPKGLAEIVRLVDRTTLYVSQLKLFARRDAGRVEPVRLSVIVAEAMAIAEPKRRRCDVVLALDVNDATVLADSTRASGILVNLLSNGFDAVAASGCRKVDLIARVVGDRAVLEVRDHGRGLSPQALAKLFEPFYTTKPAGKGSGLGLTLSMDSARRMGANLKGANHPGGGALFTLDMPLARQGAVSAEPASRRTPAIGAIPAPARSSAKIWNRAASPASSVV